MTDIYSPLSETSPLLPPRQLLPSTRVPQWVSKVHGGRTRPI